MTAYGGLALSWDKIADDITEYRIYLSTASTGDLYAKYAASQPTLTVPATRGSICVTAQQFAWTTVVYASVSAVNSSGIESSLSEKTVYILAGNIYDRDNVATGAVNILDMQALLPVFGKTVIHQVFDCNQDFVLRDETDLEAADFNRDGRIDFRDQAVVGTNFGKATQ